MTHCVRRQAYHELPSTGVRTLAAKWHSATRLLSGPHLIGISDSHHALDKDEGIAQEA
jgi:hypothetical protein